MAEASPTSPPAINKIIEAIVQNIEKKFLSCSICFDQLTDPIGLPCLHAFCYGCLDKWYEASGHVGRIVCPACKKPAQVPADGIRGFPGHFMVKNLKETVDMEKLKANCSSIVVGASVKIKASTPEDKLGDLTCLDIGTVTSIEDDEVTVDFPEHQSWQGLVSEVEVVHNNNRDATCDLCDHPSDTYCLDCQQYHCNQCQINHNAFKSMSDHEIVPAIDFLSGNVTDEGRYCELHGEPVRYYCWNEKKQVCHDCVSLKTCYFQHKRVTIEEAARNQRAELRGMVSWSDETRQSYERALSMTSTMMVKESCDYEKAQDKLERMQEEANVKMKKLWDKKGQHLKWAYRDNKTTIEYQQKALQEEHKKMQETCESAIEIANEGSEKTVTHNFKKLEEELRSISRSHNPSMPFTYGSHSSYDVGRLEDYLKPKVHRPTNRLGYAIVSKTPAWERAEEFSTSEHITDLQSIAVSPDGSIFVGSQGNKAAIFTADKNFSCMLANAPNNVSDVAVTTDERYVICGNNKLLCYNDKGKSVSTISTTSSYPPVCIALDRQGRMIVGHQRGSSYAVIIIFYADGTQMTQIEVFWQPSCISPIGYKKLVVSMDDTIEIINYSGKTEQYVSLPGNVSSWNSGRTCCSLDDEIYVMDKGSIYLFSDEGRYLGIVTEDVTSPRAIAFGNDDEELYVAESDKVTIFRKKKNV